MAYWLLKSEPVKYPWDRLCQDRRTCWDGVRNFQALGYMKAMKLGERALFYHSNLGLEVVGIAEILREYYPDPSDDSGRFGMVDVGPVIALARPVSLKQIKADPLLVGMALVRQSRLSVSPVSEPEWTRLLALGGLAA